MLQELQAVAPHSGTEAIVTASEDRNGNFNSRNLVPTTYSFCGIRRLIISIMRLAFDDIVIQKSGHLERA